ncbi:iron reductase [Auriscalpium vulgare]|uniref:Iron reductase n=1 Tax=Auriscalpium vulgare TaxID=40419 RepID=A0ACB8S5E3_9AGAM|nr:iron reductase [Auriscalpium vulgare]
MYIAILFTWSLINTTTVAGHHFDAGYYANRAGAIASVQTPLIVALGMRNNIIAWATGISFEKLNFLHRMCARTVMVVVWLHAGGRIYLGLTGPISASHGFIQAGYWSAIGLAVLVLVSIRPVRKASYEIFVLVHLALVLVMLIGAYYHTKRFEVDSYIWPSFVLWGFDRAIRLVRLFIFNHSYFGFKSGLGTFNATVEPVASGFVRVRFRRPKHLHWSPGQSAFLTMPGVSMIPFESHPFTIANADLDHLKHDEAQDFDEKKQGGEVTPSSHGKDLVFIIKAREGFTKRLGDIADGQGTLKVFVDGPYGAPPRLQGFDTTVYIAGGSGVTFTSPLFVDLLHRARVNPSACRNFVFVWAVRDLSHINLVYDDLYDSLKQNLPSCNIDVRIFITSADVDSIPPSEASSANTSAQQDKANEKIKRLPHSTVEIGRPNVHRIIEEAASLAQGPMAVSVCGPDSLSNNVRSALRGPAAGPMSVLRGGPSISLFVEAFGYAVSP